MNDSDMLAIGKDTDALAAINWHHTIGWLIQSLGEPRFWDHLVQALGDCVPLDNWVAVRFERNSPPVVLGVTDSADEQSMRLFETYLQTAYLIDPFYIALRSATNLRQTSFLTLAEIAPDQFTQTDYYQTYFRLHVMADEVQFVLHGADDSWVSLSLGNARKYTPAQLGLLRLVTPWVTALIGKHVAQQQPAIRHEKSGEPPLKPALPVLGPTLTAREQEVMYLLLSGHSSKLIGRKLGISDETVKVHRRHIYAKFNVSTHSQLFSIFLAQNEASQK